MSKAKSTPAGKAASPKTPVTRRSARHPSVAAPADSNDKPFKRSAQFWKTALEELSELKQATGSCTVTMVASRRLQSIAQALRRSYESGTLPASVQEAATALGFAWANRDDTRWETRYAEAQAFHRAFGHCTVEQNNPHYRKLAIWLTKQRQLLRAGQVPPDRKAQLEALGVNGDKLLKTWAERLSELLAHVASNSNWLDSGAAGVPADLLAWIETQRRRLATGRLTPEQESALAAVGIVRQQDGGRGHDRMMYKRVSVLAATHGTCDFAQIREAQKLRAGGDLPAEALADLCGLEVWLDRMREAHALNTLTGQWKGRLNRLPGYVDPLFSKTEVNQVRGELVQAQAAASGLAHERVGLQARVATLEAELAAARISMDAARAHAEPVLQTLKALDGAAFEGPRAQFLREAVQQAGTHAAELGNVLAIQLKVEDEYPLAESGLGTRARNALRNEGYATLKQVADSCRRMDLYRMPGLGTKTIAEIIEELRLHGLHLQPDPVRPVPVAAEPVLAEPTVETAAADNECSVEAAPPAPAAEAATGPLASEVRAELERATNSAASGHGAVARRASVGSRVLNGLRQALGLGGGKRSQSFSPSR